MEQVIAKKLNITGNKVKKIFLPYTVIRNNSIKLAHQIYKDGFVPDIIYVSLRGGAYVGNVISEYFKIVQKNKKPVLYAAVSSHSYRDIKDNSSVKIDGWTYPPEYFRSGDKILFIDEIFDSGKTINYLCNIILSAGVNREDLKVAVHDYKYFLDNSNNLPIQPDYYCKKHIIENQENDIWIHYMSHELQGLTREELAQYYYNDDPELKDIFDLLR